MELDALNENLEAISKLGATLVLISPNTIAHNQSIAEEKKLACDLLSDPGNTVAARYGLKYTMWWSSGKPVRCRSPRNKSSITEIS